MASERAWMRAVRPSFLFAKTTTTMSWNLSIILRVSKLPTKTVILRHWFRILIFTLRTAPVEILVLLVIFITVQYPFLHTFKM